MGKKPFVSFCLFTYNQEKYIFDALEGAVSQDYDNMEIIISDDCSKDKTQKIIDVFVSNYHGKHQIHINKNENNMGIAQHVNKILYELAKGEIIIIAAGDDKSLPNRTSITVDYFNRFPEITSLSFLTQAVDEKLVPRASYESLTYRPHSFSILTINDYINFNLGCFSGDSRALRKSVIDSFPPLTYASAEDYFLYLRSLMIGSVCYIRENVLLRRLHGENVSSSVPTRNRTKRNYNQFKVDIEWAYDHKYISEKTRNDLKIKVKRDCQYSIIYALRMRFIEICKNTRFIRSFYYAMKRN